MSTYVEPAASVSEAWLRTVEVVVRGGGRLVNVLTTITKPGVEDAHVRGVIDQALAAKGRREMEEFDTSGQGAHPAWPDRFFARIVDGYLARTSNAGGRVGDAECFLSDARGLLAFALEAMRAAATGAPSVLP